MNMKTTLALAALCLLAFTAAAPTAAAFDRPGTQVCGDFPGATCGSAKDSWLTVKDDALGCITSHSTHPFNGC